MQRSMSSLSKRNLHGGQLDLVILGMGEDGHTASLFPGTNALNITDSLVVANEVPQKSCWRMTFTFQLINMARNIVLYVMGDAKQERVAEVLFDRNDSFPSGRIGTRATPAVWILDELASKKLLKVWNSKGDSKQAI